MHGAEPYAHIGLGSPPVHEDEREGLTCDDCEMKDFGNRAEMYHNFQEHWAGVSFASVPGGASVARPGGGKGPGPTPKQQEQRFNKGMYDYKANRDAGLKPDSTRVGGVEKAYKRAERNERLVKKVESGELEAKGIVAEKALRRQIGMKE